MSVTYRLYEGNPNESKNSGVYVVSFLVIFLALLSLFTVHEGHQAILLRLGTIVSDKNDAVEVLGPGLHARVPFITQVKNFDMRLQTLGPPPSRVGTAR